MSKEFYCETVRDKILSLFYPEAGNMVADIGSGTGFLSEGLTDKPVSIIAIDQSREMLKQMKRKFHDAKNIDYRVGNANHLPVRDNILDYALANMYLHHVDDPPRAIGEIFRILRSGGRLILTDLEAHKFDYMREEHHDIWLGFDHKVVQQWLTGVGFKNVSVESIKEYCCANAGINNKRAKISIFLATGEKP